MKKTSAAFSLILIFCSCKKEREEKVYPMVNVSNAEREKCKALALQKGDTLAYNVLSTEFFDSPNEGVFLYTALIMANKYNYGRAYDDAYMCLTDAYHKKDSEELDDLDIKTKQLALDLLFRGVKVNNKDCMRNLGHQYMIGKHLQRDESKGKELLEKSY